MKSKLIKKSNIEYFKLRMFIFIDYIITGPHPNGSNKRNAYLMISYSSALKRTVLFQSYVLTFVNKSC